MFKLVQEDTGQPHHALLSKPTLREDCIKYYDAFRILGVSRIWSQVGPQPIAISEILKLTAEGLGITDYDTRMKYVRLIQRMDQVECEHHRETLKSRTPKASK